MGKHEKPPAGRHIKPKTRARKVIKNTIEWAVVLVLAVGAVVFIKTNHIEVSPVVSESMEPYLMKGDAAISVGTDIRAPQVGDVIVFTADLSPKSRDVRVVHRWIGYKEDGTLLTQGDNNDAPDRFRVDLDRVVGVQVASLPTHHLRNGLTIPIAGAVVFFLIAAVIVVSFTGKDDEESEADEPSEPAQPALDWYSGGEDWPDAPPRFPWLESR